MAFLYSRRVRETLLVAHIAVAVSLLGDSAGFLAIAIRASRLDDPVRINELISVLDMLSVVFGIPLSFASIVTGVALGLGTKWGVFRYPWVIAKLLLIISVMVVGGVVINPAQTRMLNGTGNGVPQLIAAGAYDVVALTIAVALSVFKPGRSLRGGKTPIPA